MNNAMLCKVETTKRCFVFGFMGLGQANVAWDTLLPAATGPKTTKHRGGMRKID